MKDATKQGWKRIGWLAFSFLPMLGYLLLMLAVTVGIDVLLTVYAIARGEENLTEYLLQYTMHCSVAYTLLGLLLFGLWYYFGCKRKQLLPKKGTLDIKNILAICAVAFGAQFMVNYLMILLGLLFPDAMDHYVEMMDMAGIGDFSLMMVLYAIILGPVLEELIYRGITLFYTRKFTRRFWLANIVQALAFATMHMNLVQGIYAFAMGLLMGWVYDRFHSLYATILLHIVFNLLGCGPWEALSGGITNLYLRILWNVVGVLLFFGGVLYIWKKKKSVSPT